MAIHNHQGQERESKFHPERNGTTIKTTIFPQTGSREPYSGKIQRSYETNHLKEEVTGEVAGDEDEGRINHSKGGADVAPEVVGPLRMVDAEVEVGELHHPHHRFGLPFHLDHVPPRLPRPALGLGLGGGSRDRKNQYCYENHDEEVEEPPFSHVHGVEGCAKKTKMASNRSGLDQREDFGQNEIHN